jgi:phosphoglycerol transferase MdoB-like AlkP superfamily enzyme
LNFKILKQRLIILTTGFIGWTSFFLLGRALFLAFQFHFTKELSLVDFLLVFAHGIRMDWATAGHLSLIPGLLLTITFFLKGKYIWPFWFGYHALLLAVVSFIIVVDLELYSHWGIRLDATPLLYVGKEVAGSGEFWKSVLLILFWLVFFGGSLYLTFRFFKSRVLSLEPSSWPAAPILLFATALLIIPIRGSFGVAPMNTGFVFFHRTNMFANHAAINVVWNFGYSLHKMDNLKYPDNYFDKEKTNTQFSKLFPATKSNGPVLIKGKPNVMIIILESYTYKFIEPLGGLKGVAPNINALVKEGILFDNFYSSGDRTDKGLISVLSAYPAQPLASIIKYPNKTKSLPFLNQVFKEQGYRTEFSYGYNIDYANFRSYLINAGFDNLTHSDHFPQELNTSKWGVHDEFVFQKFFEEAEQSTQPFFKIMMTQSSHEPFEVPMPTVFPGTDLASMFTNSAHYTDKTFGEFIDKAKKSDWWDNTLIVVTADHGHPEPNNGNFASATRYKIPMLWLGGALTVRDTVIHTIAGHTDIANTVLGQFGLQDKRFTFSHNILSQDYDPFAVFIFNNGFGLVQQNKLLVYDNIGGAMIVDEGNTPDDLERGKAFMQKLYWDYNSRKPLLP